MDLLGKLEKMKILAFQDDAYSQPATIPTFPVLVNPESYSMDYSVEFNTESAPGNNAPNARYNRHSPEQFSCDLWFDNTGIMDGIPQPDVFVQIELFKKFLLDLESSTHQPRYFMVIWGKMFFKGRCTGVQIQYKLFKPDGTPIRAVIKVTFKSSVNEQQRAAAANLQSPDLTHRRQVKAGDTLPNLCYAIYGSPLYCNEVARANQLTNFRSLIPGTILFFPPFDKQEKN